VGSGFLRDFGLSGAVITDTEDDAGGGGAGGQGCSDWCT
jgi:hypothetical protein